MRGSPMTTCTQDERPPEQLLAEAMKRDLGIVIDPQALRIFIRWRWNDVQRLAHRIHDEL